MANPSSTCTPPSFLHTPYTVNLTLNIGSTYANAIGTARHAFAAVTHALPGLVLRYVTLSAGAAGCLGYHLGEEEAMLHASLFWSCGSALAALSSPVVALDRARSRDILVT